MRALLRPALTALGVACLISAASVASSGSALAQAKQQPAPSQAAPAETPTLKQIALTDKQIDGVLAAQKDMDAITAKLPDAKVDVSGGGGHYTIGVVSTGFAGKNLLESQRLVLGAIKHLLAGERAPVHAVDSLTTRTP